MRIRGKVKAKPDSIQVNNIVQFVGIWPNGTT